MVAEKTMKIGLQEDGLEATTCSSRKTSQLDETEDVDEEVLDGSGWFWMVLDGYGLSSCC